ncbi:hypothetical protein MRB53_040353 [Persea americana]|nr:hypothetical protein MRB53_040353 [Persea americana]
MCGVEQAVEGSPGRVQGSCCREEMLLRRGLKSEKKRRVYDTDRVVMHACCRMTSNASGLRLCYTIAISVVTSVSA